MRVRIAASAPPMVMAGSTRWAGEPEPDTGSHPSSIAKNKMRIGPSAKLGNDKPEQRNEAEQAIVPAIAAQRRAHSRRNRQAKRHDERGQRQLHGRWIRLRDDVADILIEAQRASHVAVQNTAPVVHVLLAERNIEAISVTRRSQSVAAAPSPSICWMGSPGTRWISRKTTETTSHTTGSM